MSVEASSHVAVHTTVSSFAERAHVALNDKPLRANFRRAMDGLMAKRAVQFPDAGDLPRRRSLGAAIKERALTRLPELLEQLEARCTENGIKVHWAETTGDANRIVLDIFQ